MKFIFALFLLFNLSFADTLVQEGDKKNWCSLTAKDLKTYYKFSHVINTDDDVVMQYCSLGDLAFDSMTQDVLFSTFQAVDYSSGELMDTKTSENAFYLINSSLVLEMAFKDEAEALKHQKEFGGEITDFDDAYLKGYFRVEKELEKNVHKNEKKFFPMGRRAYEKLCEPLEKSDYRFINELKADIFKKCENMDERKADLIANFIWFDENKDRFVIEVTHDDKCPVCGMFVYKYPRWAAIVYYDDEGEYYSFDGVKDMMKFLFYRDQYIKEDSVFGDMYVTDYYTQNAIEAKTAYYVVGSNIFGPMGNELIPFEKESNARTFKLEHGGTEIYKFDEITTSIICALDGRVCD
ncbi:MAG: hypothetical protein GX282_06715 [Campylobacteraceae bacterium]|nr:hypothetical protein [Campylobacteraceae bacterium]